jgi:hypothetical protein
MDMEQMIFHIAKETGQSTENIMKLPTSTVLDMFARLLKSTKENSKQIADALKAINKKEVRVMNEIKSFEEGVIVLLDEILTELKKLNNKELTTEDGITYREDEK